MDIHRSRFVPYAPAAINALAFSHPSYHDAFNSGNSTLRLAIGRANGDIEIWNPSRGVWVQEVIFHGGKDRSVEGLAWIQEPDTQDTNGNTIPGQLRLFSIGYASAVTEWDLSTGLPLRHSGGNHSEVWCLAAQPRRQAAQTRNATEGEYRGQNLVAGCADGTLVLLSTAENDLQFQKFLARPTAKKARILSVTYQNRNVVVAGSADSTIRVIDARNGSLLRNITLGAGPAGAPKETLVWTVKCLPNGDIVSGDSTGEVRFFDGKTFSQLQRISSHEQDVLDVAVSTDGQTVFSGGMDRRTVVYKLRKAGPRSRWAEISHNRHHEHDVKAMAVYENKKMSVVASGGLDTNPIIIPLREYGKESTRTISGLPQSPPITSAPGPRLIVSWWSREVSIWRMRRHGVAEKSHRLVAQIALKGEENVNHASLSGDGTLLAVSTAAGVKVFHLAPATKEQKECLRIRKLEAPKALFTYGARLVHLSPDGKWLVAVSHTNDISVSRLVHDDQLPAKHRFVQTSVTLKRLPRKAAENSALAGTAGVYQRTIVRVQFSHGSKLLITGDLLGYLDSWILEGHEDPTAPEVDITSPASSSEDDEDDDEDDEEKHPVVILGQHWIRNPSGHLLPRLKSAPLILSFRPSVSDEKKPEPNGNPAVHPTRHNLHPHSHDLPQGDYRLFALTAQHQIYEFDMLDGRLTDWSRRNPTSSLPPPFQNVRDRAMGCVWHVTKEWQRIWLYGSNWLYMFDLAQDLADPESPEEDGKPNGAVDGEVAGTKKRKRISDQGLVRNSTSGAGSKKPERELLGVGRKMRKVVGGDSTEGQWIPLDQAKADADEDDSEVEASGPLMVEREAHDAVNGIAAEESNRPAKWWHTHKYRPILGMVPIGETGSKSKALEVVLVERPFWDLDLPPRFVGQHER